MLSTLRDRMFDIFLAGVQRIPYPVTHNLEKARVLRKVFWHLNLEGLKGDYFEFGVAFGNSLEAARLAAKSARAPQLGISAPNRRFFGFDTFDSFSSNDKEDQHLTWQGGKFSFPYEAVKKRFRRRSNVTILKGDATELGGDTDFNRFAKEQIGADRKAAVAMFDMDLRGPTAAALEFVFPMLQDGAILIFDEFFGFGGRPELGESGALQEFLDKHPEIKLREYAHYGDGGRVFQVHFS